MDPETAATRVAKLTDKELEALELVAAHYSSKEIAIRLDLSIAAIDARVRAVLRKLEVADRRQAALVLASARGHAAQQAAAAPYQPRVYQPPQVVPDAVPYRMDGPNEHAVQDVHQGFPVDRSEAATDPRQAEPASDGGARNRLSAIQRIGLIAAIAVGTIVALGGMISVMNGLLQIVAGRGQLL